MTTAKRASTAGLLIRKSGFLLRGVFLGDSDSLFNFLFSNWKKNSILLSLFFVSGFLLK